MVYKGPAEMIEEYCAAGIRIREQFGLVEAVDYLVGEKFMTYAQLAETDPKFLSQLPLFRDRIRGMFRVAEIEECFTRATRHSMVDPRILSDLSAEEAEELQETLQEDVREQARREWVKAMLLSKGS